MTQRRATIPDVARLAGVSIGTVSNVLNDTVPVADETRARVERAIARLGFVRNSHARSLIRTSRPARRDGDVRTPRLVSVGYVSADYTAKVNALPHRDERATARTIDKSLGGPAANVAALAAGLGAPFAVQADLITVVGLDPESDWAMAEIVERGVGTSFIRRTPDRRLSRCLVIVEPSGGRTIVNEPFQFDKSDLDPLDGLDDPPDRRRCIHIEGYQVDSLRSRVAKLRAAGWTASIQATGLPASRLTEAGLAGLADSFDVVIVNREAVRTATGWRGSEAILCDRFAAIFSQRRAGPVVLTLGEKGALVLPPDRSGPVAVPALPVEAVDTTGAGDAFTGIFLAVWLNTGDAVMAARHGCIGASLVVTRPTAQGLVPSAKRIGEMAEAETMEREGTGAC
ncbi:ribokinase [Skermanella aerolata]|uniref:Ribokinase n=1 Tax=Skermanella aerolata TaxID=393310 RepID=A0A512DIU5_9PROT|nr:carbohydrate kinase family protein [Skermanella aerolata]KJB97406.1 carbohydrate kinase [Skermanella aerolata KACC 11604]GEO36403.1 ribokinase [Skermanella aerolata]